MDQHVQSTDRFILDLSTDPIWILGAGGRVDGVSTAVEQVLGYRRDELEGTNVFALIHPDDEEPLADQCARLADGEALGRRFRLRYRHAEGHWLTLEAKGTVVSHDVGGTGVLVVTRGPTSEALLQEELSCVRRGADETDQAWNEVLSSVRHELRTPLHAIMGFGQLLQQDDLDDEQRDCVAQILRAGRYLLELVDGTVGSPIDAVPVARAAVAPVAVRAALEEAVALIRPLAEARAIGLHDHTQETAVGAEVMADPGHLKQVLVNLLSNAVKYNRHAGSITVACDRVTGDSLRLSITDTGSGIETEAVDRIFRPYERIATEGDVEGTGLGLAISKRLASAMGAVLGVDSVVGTGTTFWIDMPVVAASPTRRETPVEQPYGK